MSFQSPRPESLALNWIDAVKCVSGNGITAIDAGKLLKPYWREAKKLKLTNEEKFEYSIRNAKRDAEELRKTRGPSKPKGKASPSLSALSPRNTSTCPVRIRERNISNLSPRLSSTNISEPVSTVSQKREEQCQQELQQCQQQCQQQESYCNLSPRRRHLSPRNIPYSRNTSNTSSSSGQYRKFSEKFSPHPSINYVNNNSNISY